MRIITFITKKGLAVFFSNILRMKLVDQYFSANYSIRSDSKVMTKQLIKGMPLSSAKLHQE